MSQSLTPTTVDELQDIVRSHERLHPRGGGTKSALSTPLDGTEHLELSKLSGIVEYDPGELTFTLQGRVYVGRGPHGPV